jgi:hypothetical protein
MAEDAQVESSMRATATTNSSVPLLAGSSRIRKTAGGHYCSFTTGSERWAQFSALPKCVSQSEVGQLVVLLRLLSAAPGVPFSVFFIWTINDDSILVIVRNGNGAQQCACKLMCE